MLYSKTWLYSFAWRFVPIPVHIDIDSSQDLHTFEWDILFYTLVPQYEDNLIQCYLG